MSVTYLDYQATTPLAPEVYAAMEPWLTERFANPHSAHRLGREAAAGVAVARDQITALMPPGGDIIFTASATEALNLALKGVFAKARATGRDGIVTIATEHSAVLDTVQALASESGARVTILPVDGEGIVELAGAAESINERTAIVAAMLVNNEIGVLQPVDALAELAHRSGALFLCDAVQGYGRVPLPAEADLIAVSAHKIYGPKGIGALWRREGIALAPLIHGGGQEHGLRSGTLSPALCAGFGVAAQLMATRQQDDNAHSDAIWQAVMTSGHLDRWTINGNIDRRLHANLNIHQEGVDAARLFSELRDIAFALGSACASGSGRPSHVLAALGLSRAQTRGSIRVGWGRYSDPDLVVAAVQRISAAAAAQIG